MDSNADDRRFAGRAEGGPHRRQQQPQQRGVRRSGQAPLPAPAKRQAPVPRAINGHAGGKAGRPRTDWGEVAEWYDRLVGDTGSEYQREVVHPGVLRLLALQKGETFVDVACGQGVLCRLAHERGVAVTGVDAAGELIKAARERGPAEIKYVIGDARELKFLPTERFEAAGCVLAIQNIHPIQPVFEHVARVLKQGGRFVMAMMHPCFRGPKETGWGWDEEQRVQYRRVDRYLLPRKSPIVTHPGKSPDVYTWTFHKPVEAYVKSLRNAGLLIDAVEEWASHKVSEEGGRSAAENAARKEIPMFMAIRAVKVAGYRSEAAAG